MDTLSTDMTFCTTKDCMRREKCLRAMDYLKNFESIKQKSYADFKCTKEKAEHLIRVNVLRT